MLPDQILVKIKEARVQGRLIGYHKWDDDPTFFLVGFVQAIESDRILFEQVGTQGEPENKTDVAMMEKIIWLEFETDYLLGLEKLYPVYDELIGRKPSAGIRVTRAEAIEKNLRVASSTREAVTINIGDQKLMHSLRT